MTRTLKIRPDAFSRNLPSANGCVNAVVFFLADGDINKLFIWYSDVYDVAK